jgi:putative redox protein
MTIKLTRVGDSGFHLDAQNEGGLSVSFDNVSGSSSPKGVSPMESVLMAVAGCSSIDIIDILEKGRLTLDHYDVEVTGTRRDEVPRVFTAIDVHVITQGDFPSDRVERAVKLSLERYCSVSIMLQSTVTFSARGTHNGASYPITLELKA